MKLVYYSNRMHINGDYLEKRGLGGSESCLINLTRALKNNYKNLDIIVYNGNRENTEVYDDIVYKSARSFIPDCVNLKADVFISLRDIFPFKLPYIDSKIKILHSQDDKHERELQQLMNMKYSRENIDGILAISEYAKNSIKEMFLEKKVFLQRNGYNNQLIKNEEKNRDPIAIYTSTPYRGLDILCELWGSIYSSCVIQNVKPELWVFGDMSLYDWSNKDFEGIFSYLRTLPGVKTYGAVCQKNLYEFLTRSKVMLYPNTFLETGCMAVLEALACGNWIVTTNLGALGEQVINGDNGILIDGNAYSEEYKKLFLKHAVDALCNDKKSNTKEKVIFSWDEQAKNLMNILLSMRE